jgi:hypothetical protein
MVLQSYTQGIPYVINECGNIFQKSLGHLTQHLHVFKCNTTNEQEFLEVISFIFCRAGFLRRGVEKFIRTHHTRLSSSFYRGFVMKNSSELRAILAETGSATFDSTYCDFRCPILIRIESITSVVKTYNVYKGEPEGC